jgi:MtN3 and saliva related transmembrane protein
VSALVADAVGVGAARCSMTSFAPQIAKMWRERDASSVSLRMYLVTVAGFSLWIAYGALVESWPVAVSNGISFVMSAAVLSLKWRFSRARARRPPRRSQP